jgi:4-amino-4-deoxy-L-arabinose transferase-like glycosyltransferase
VFGLLAAMLLWAWMSRAGGARSGANSALVLVASFIGLRYFRSGEADAVLIFFVSSACLLGFDILQGRRDGQRPLLFGLALGLGFLSKGPAALAIPLLTLALMALIDKRAGRLQARAGDFFSVAAISLLLFTALGWYAWIIWRFPDIAQQFFAKQVDETFVSGTHAKPLWWYLAHWFEFFAPWGVLIIPAGWMACRRGSRGLPPLVRFAWVWLAVVLVLLTATVNKQTQYALLLAPPLALVVGHYLAEADGGFARANRLLFGLFCIAAAAGVVVALRKSTDIPLALAWLALPITPLLLRRLLREQLPSAPVLLVAGVTAMAYLYSEAYLSNEPHKVAAQTLLATAAQHAPLYQLRTVLNDGALSFYAGRVVPPADAAEIARLLQAQSEIWLIGAGLPELPGLDAQIEMKVDDLTLYRLQRKAPAGAK